MERVEVIPVGRVKRQLGGEERRLAEPGQSVHALLEGLGLDPGSVMVIVNDRRVPKSYMLRRGDKVKLLRLIAGG